MRRSEKSYGYCTIGAEDVVVLYAYSTVCAGTRSVVGHPYE